MASTPCAFVFHNREACVCCALTYHFCDFCREAQKQSVCTAKLEQHLSEAKNISSIFSKVRQARQSCRKDSEAGWKCRSYLSPTTANLPPLTLQDPTLHSWLQHGQLAAAEGSMEPRTAGYCCHMPVLNRRLRPVLSHRTAPGCNRRHVRQTRQRCAPSAAVGPAPKAPDGGDNWEPWKKKSKDVKPATTWQCPGLGMRAPFT